MNNEQFFIYLLIMVVTTYVIRAVPFGLVERQIKNRFIRSFLTYIPYAVLTVMTIPGIFYATGSLASAVAGFAVAVIVACIRPNLTLVAVCACVAVYVVSLVG